MISRKNIFTILAFLFLLAPIQTTADELVEIPEEELARESVYPVFDKLETVKRRNVDMESRIELSVLGGTSMNIAFFDQIMIGGAATYHMSNTSGIQVLGAMIDSKNSSYVPQMNDQVDPDPNFQYLPKPKYLLIGAYEFSPYYGKISLTKQGVMNLTTFFTFGAGVMGIGDGTVPLVSLGVGQNYFFSKNWGLKLDLRGLIYNGPDPLSVDLANRSSEPSLSEYEKKLVLNFTLSAGLVILL